MNLPRVIGLYSPAPQQGKSSIASYLKRKYGYQVVSFATPIKRMASQFLHGMGYSPAEIDGFLTEGKSFRHPVIGVDTRHILQTLGTEWGRNCIHTDCWVHIWERQVKSYLALGHNIVTDDIRFVNEYRALRHCHPDNVFWRVTRSSFYDKIDPHPSEGFAENNSNVLIDCEIRNFSDKNYLYDSIDILLKTGNHNATAVRK